MMRFLANENFPLDSVKKLRKAGHDVAAIVEDAPGAKDSSVMARACREGRTILTFDRDYGEMIYRLGFEPPRAIVYFRFAPCDPEEPAERLEHLMIMKEFSLSGKFTVVERERIRQRPLL